MKWIGVPIWVIILAMFGPFYFWFMLSDEIARKRQKQRAENQHRQRNGQRPFAYWYRKDLGKS